MVALAPLAKHPGQRGATHITHKGSSKTLFSLVTLLLIFLIPSTNHPSLVRLKVSAIFASSDASKPMSPLHCDPCVVVPRSPLDMLNDPSAYAALLPPPGMQPGFQGSAHEREGDFSSWLYAESNRLYFLDQPGPLCVARTFYAASGVLADNVDGTDFFERSTLNIEVDGREVLNLPASRVFFNGTVFPPSLTPSIPGLFFSRAGVSILSPICANKRLRLSWEFPPHPSLPSTAAEILAQTDACVGNDLMCNLKQYFDTSFVRLPGTNLPDGWGPFDGGGGPPTRATAASPPLPPAAPLSGLTHLEGLLSSPTTTTHRSCGTLSPHSASSHTLLQTPPNTPGTVLALVVDFSMEGGGDSRGGESTPNGLDLGLSLPWSPLPHSKYLHLEGVWDGEGSADGGTSGGGDGGGGALRTDLSSLFGPPYLGYGEAQIRTLPSQQVGLGTTPRGFYISLPAPFWQSARISLTLRDGSRSEKSEGGETGKEEERNEEFESLGNITLCSRVVLLAQSTPPHPTSGYLMASPYGFFIEKAKENRVFGVAGRGGKLVALTSFLEARRGTLPTSVVEGDLRVFTDNSSSPVSWDSGYEDFFNGAHTYEFGTGRVEQPLFSHQRRDTPRFMTHSSSSCVESAGLNGCSQWESKLHPDTDLFSVRIMAGLDAIPWRHSVEVGLEGFSGEYDMARTAGVAVWYASPTLPTQPPTLWDVVYPGAEVFQQPKESRRHGYEVVGVGGTTTTTTTTTTHAPPLFHRYDLTSAFAGRGEPVEVEDGRCPIRSTGHGAASGADYFSCPAPLLSLPVLAIGGGGGSDSWGAGVGEGEGGGYIAVRFQVVVDGRGGGCALRYVSDAAWSGGWGELWVEGERVGWVGVSERAYLHLNTRWREGEVTIPRHLREGGGVRRVEVEVRVWGGGGGGGQGGGHNRTYPGAHLGVAWSEAKWTSLCFY